MALTSDASNMRTLFALIFLAPLARGAQTVNPAFLGSAVVLHEGKSGESTRKVEAFDDRRRVPGSVRVCITQPCTIRHATDIDPFHPLLHETHTTLSGDILVGVYIVDRMVQKSVRVFLLNIKI